MSDKYYDVDGFEKVCKPDTDTQLHPERLRVMRTNCEESQPDHELPLPQFLRSLAMRIEHVRGAYVKQEDADRLRAHAFALDEVMR